MDKELIKKQIEKLKQEIDRLENQLYEYDRGPFDRVGRDETIYFISSIDFNVRSTYEAFTHTDNDRFKLGNYFNDENVAKECSKYLKQCLIDFKNNKRSGMADGLYLKCAYNNEIGKNKSFIVGNLYKIENIAGSKVPIFKVIGEDSERRQLPLTGNLWGFGIVNIKNGVEMKNDF